MHFIVSILIHLVLFGGGQKFSSLKEMIAHRRPPGDIIARPPPYDFAVAAEMRSVFEFMQASVGGRAAPRGSSSA
jgi:hypothetical protein